MKLTDGATWPQGRVVKKLFLRCLSFQKNRLAKNKQTPWSLTFTTTPSSSECGIHGFLARHKGTCATPEVGGLGYGGHDNPRPGELTTVTHRDRSPLTWWW